MIYKQDCFSVECDRCKIDYEQSYTGYSVFVDPSSAIEAATDDGWGVVCVVDKEADMIYCPDCHTVDEDGNVVCNETEEIN